MINTTRLNSQFTLRRFAELLNCINQSRQNNGWDDMSADELLNILTSKWAERHWEKYGPYSYQHIWIRTGWIWIDACR